MSDDNDQWEVVDTFTMCPGSIYGLACNGRILVKWACLGGGTWDVYRPEVGNQTVGEFTTREYAETFARQLVNAPGISIVPEVFRDGS